MNRAYLLTTTNALDVLAIERRSRTRAHLMRWLAAIVLLAAGTLTTATADEVVDAGFFYTYDILPGQRQSFEDGYRKHLNWHADAGDTFTWYGWYVVTGNNLSRFIDATIGISLSDFDNRIRPGDDARHFEEFVSAYVEPVSRTIFRLRPDLGSPTISPTKFDSRYVQATTYVVSIGARETFEKLVKDLIVRTSDALQGEGTSVFELRDGGSHHTYLFLQQLRSVSEMNTALPLLESRSVKSAESELWFYRSALSYLPEAE